MVSILKGLHRSAHARDYEKIFIPRCRLLINKACLVQAMPQFHGSMHDGIILSRFNRPNYLPSMYVLFVQVRIYWYIFCTWKSRKEHTPYSVFVIPCIHICIPVYGVF